MKPKVGSRWRELDPRVKRVVRIVGHDAPWIRIVNDPGGTRTTRVHSDNFTKRFEPIDLQEVAS